MSGPKDDDHDDQAPRLGDLLGPDAPAPQQGTKSAPLYSPWNPRPYDRALCALAAHLGEDPEAVLQDFHGNGALARLLRKTLDMPDYT
ncbi:hypothetical protein [Paracoccus yeei]|jgi:hypothetical protein|uniref:hypothetical protein n=1 Tax=Paracoccus yeei TaxID=147645 RepID=UPI003BF8B66E